MPGFSLRARRPAGGAERARVTSDPDILKPHLEDAAHFAGGHARELVAPANEAEVAEVVRTAQTVLPIGAQSSLTGGATPMGETILSTRRLTGIKMIGVDRVRVGAGVTLAALDEALEAAGRSYAPSPTFTGAFVGGIVATNAAGAATFKHGTTRDWVDALTVVLPSGDVLDIERGDVRADADGYFVLQLETRTVKVPVPRYRMPRLPKLSAGYFAAPGMDLIDLFIGSEGTLGIVTAVTLRVLPIRPAVCLALVPFDDRRSAVAFARQLRDAAKDTWRSCSRRGVDVAAIEHMDARSLAIVREDGADRTNGVTLADSAVMALLVTLELPPGTTAGQAFDEIGRTGDARAPDTPLVRFCTMLLEAGVLEQVEIAVPGDRMRAAQLLAIREAVPAGVNARIGRAKQEIDPRIEKTAADVIVPFDRIGELLDVYDAELGRRGLDAAVWGHLSDGNLHPNVIPRSFDDVQSGKEAMIEFGRAAIRLGGAPLAEHGVGRNPVKQLLLREMYGEEGVDQMRAVKRAIDPDWKMAPGVLFES